MTDSWDYMQDFAGGKRLLKRARVGMLVVKLDGRLSIEPEDDAYAGELSVEESLALARLVIERASGR